MKSALVLFISLDVWNIIMETERIFGLFRYVSDINLVSVGVNAPVLKSLNFHFYTLCKVFLFFFNETLSEEFVHRAGRSIPFSLSFLSVDCSTGRMNTNSNKKSSDSNSQKYN